MLTSTAILFVRAYQRVAPARLRRACRFEPSCSNYSIQAFSKYGFTKGLKLTVGRLARCRHPNGGIDQP